MSRQEIFGSAAEREGDPELEAALRKLEEARKHVQDGAEPGLWLGLQPLRHLGLDVQESRFSLLALEPSVTGNRRAGWHFARSSKQPRLVSDAIEWGLWSEAQGGSVTRVQVTERGELRFWTALEHLRHSKGESREVWPTKILEYPISAFRIARAIYHGLPDPEDRAVADLALFGIGGWGLREGTPGDFFLGNDLARVEEPDLIWEPMVFSFREIEQVPDRCGFRLVRRVYQAFGWREEDMPRQYDHKTGSLTLPE
jgi:hypothetical protein